ncbi:beta-fructofuranosidase, cell wall isozyme isoform X2 [Medicago truncatula]|uniref:beta-fructofuranosidase, cell wall isozyme isoform X2 n=1 Tax=Medicago truncatula TaxID=3880 RepID=UPI000D2F23E0|nr:beta-fructofuranosidase, cell wall isozyme isoform X2 [Medicago truncatula]
MGTSWLLATFSVIILYGFAHIEAFHQTHSSIFNLNQTYKPSFHFQPSKNWMNDPNGPMRYKGLYHMFYQHNPKGATWSNNSIVWGHSVSKDLVNWFPLQHALTPSQPYDINGCWSGSTTFVSNDKPTILYTGIDIHQHQTQNLAIPKNVSDPFLREWIKSPKNPIMLPNIVNKINATSFRDPTTAWIGHHDGLWRVLVGSQQKDNRGITLLFKSKDFINWIQAKYPFYSAKKIGMLECPDFFPVLINGTFGLDTSIKYDHDSIRYVLKVSLIDVSHDYYLIGTYDTIKDVYIPKNGFEQNNNELTLVIRYDYGKFYASKTFYDDAKKRRVLWGWINESSIREDDVQKGWSGIQAIPRTLWLDKSGKQLIQWPIVEIEKLRTNPINFNSKVLKGGTLLEIVGVTAAQADVEISFEVNELEKAQALDPSWKMDPQHLCNENDAKVKGVGLGPFGLLVLASKGMQEYTRIFFKVFRANKKHVVLMCSDQCRSSLNHKNDLTTYGAFVDVDPIHEELSIRSLIDHSVVESFGAKGKTCITARVYPTLAINDKAHLHAFNNGTVDVKIKKLSAWSMNKANINEIH